MREIDREIVSAVIISKDNKIFMGRSGEHRGQVYSDCWRIPGGGVDEGEDNITALKREMLEEAGIDIENHKIELITDDKYGHCEKILRKTNEKVLVHMHFYDYKVTIENQNADEIELKPVDDEFDEIKWFSMEEIKSAKLSPPTIELFQMMGILEE